MSVTRAGRRLVGGEPAQRRPVGRWGSPTTTSVLTGASPSAEPERLGQRVGEHAGEPGRASTRRRTSRLRTDLLATRIGFPPRAADEVVRRWRRARRGRATASGGSREAVARSSRSRARAAASSGEGAAAHDGAACLSPTPTGSTRPSRLTQTRAAARLPRTAQVTAAGDEEDAVPGTRTDRWRNWAGNQRDGHRGRAPGAAEEIAAEVLASAAAVGAADPADRQRALLHRDRPARGRPARAATGTPRLVDGRAVRSGDGGGGDAAAPAQRRARPPRAGR